MTIKQLQANYKRLIKIIPNLETMQAGDYIKLESGSYMDLNIDILEKNDDYMIFAMAHNSIQNGDIMADPDMQIKLHYNNGMDSGMIEPLTYQNDFMGIFNKVYKTIDGKKYINRKLCNSLNSFLRTWLINLKNQGFKA